jgi:signal transduction histidine kinase
MIGTIDEPQGFRDLPEELRKRKRIIRSELQRRTLGFVRLRWWVPPALVVGAEAERLPGLDFAAGPVRLVALVILGYNLALHLAGRGLKRDDADEAAVARFTYLQVALDYAAMFLLIHYTGGAASPFIFFFVFHIIFAAILLPAGAAYGFAGLAAAGMFGIGFAEYFGRLPHHALLFRGRAIDLAAQPIHMTVELIFFSASVFVTAFFATRVTGMLRKRIVALADVSEQVVTQGDRLAALYAMVHSIGTIREPAKVLTLVTGELARVMGIKAVSVKLLSEDGATLRYAAAHGLPPDFGGERAIEVAKSSLNRRIIEGEPYVTGSLSRREMFQFGEDFAAARLESVLFVPLSVEERVIGILGAYCTRPERFAEGDVEFFRLAAGLVAIAVDNARAYQAEEHLLAERGRFMLRLAHNLRAPLAAMCASLDVVRGEYLGPLDASQKEYLRRVDRRARSMIDLVNELMTLGDGGGKQAPTRAPVDLAALAGRIERTFRDEAEHKGVRFAVTAEDGVPEVRGDPRKLEQMMENLVSNAIKYTPPEGRVDVVVGRQSAGAAKFQVTDTGIGIPDAAMPRLFSEFFRAENAKAMEDVGTGLGLAIVKDTVEQHGGRVQVESRVGIGTTFTVHLPAARPEAAP